MAELKLAFLGDIVGRPGRRVVEQQLPALMRDHQPHIVIANGENARSGSGLSPAIFEKLRTYGIGCVTLGDHVFRDQRILPLLGDPSAPVLRPANLSRRAPGKTVVRIPPPEGFTRQIVVMTVLGRIFFPLPADDPFACVDDVLATLAGQPSTVLVEAHMEATSEKIALAHHLNGRVAAVLGTHTHVPTADARVLSKGTAFITDVGMCGPYDSVIGRDAESVLKHMTTAQHVQYGVAEGGASMCGAIVRIEDGTGRALSIERVEYRADHRRPPFVNP